MNFSEMARRVLEQNLTNRIMNFFGYQEQIEGFFKSALKQLISFGSEGWAAGWGLEKPALGTVCLRCISATSSVHQAEFCSLHVLQAARGLSTYILRRWGLFRSFPWNCAVSFPAEEDTDVLSSWLGPRCCRCLGTDRSGALVSLLAVQILRNTYLSTLLGAGCRRAAEECVSRR